MHNRIELSRIDGARIGQVVPLDPQLTFTLNEPGTITFDVSSSHRLASIDFIEPYATDFAFFLHDTCLMEGMITSVSGEDEANFSVAGKSWEHYLERRIYPFDPANPTLHYYAVVATDVFTIVEDILDTTLAEPYSLPLTYSNGTSGITRNLRIDPGETQSVFEQIQQLAEQKPSFDFEILPITREFKMYTPQKGAYKPDPLVKGKNVARIRFNDEGIEGNSVLVAGAGTTTKLMKLKSDTVSQQKYRRHDATQQFGDVTDPNYVDALASAELAKDAMKDYGLSVDLVPKFADEFFETYELGDNVNLRGNIDYTQFSVDDIFRVTQIDVSMNRNKDVYISLGLGNGSV